MNLITLLDWDAEQIRAVLDLGHELKKRARAGTLEPVLARRTLALLFEKASMRTRVSFEVAMTQLGGHVTYLTREDVNLGVREPVKDGARVLSRYVDGIAARVYRHSTVEELAAYATVPVINALSDLHHPCQALADMMTIEEHFRQPSRGPALLHRRRQQRGPLAGHHLRQAGAAVHHRRAAGLQLRGQFSVRGPGRRRPQRRQHQRGRLAGRSGTRCGRALHGRLDQHGPGGGDRAAQARFRRLLRGRPPAGPSRPSAASSCTTCPPTGARRSRTR